MLRQRMRGQACLNNRCMNTLCRGSAVQATRQSSNEFAGVPGKRGLPTRALRLGGRLAGQGGGNLTGLVQPGARPRTRRRRYGGQAVDVRQSLRHSVRPPAGPPLVIVVVVLLLVVHRLRSTSAGVQKRAVALWRCRPQDRHVS